MDPRSTAGGADKERVVVRHGQVVDRCAADAVHLGHRIVAVVQVVSIGAEVILLLCRYAALPELSRQCLSSSSFLYRSGNWFL